MLTMLAKLLKALNSEASPSQISIAFILGMIIGFTPLGTPHNLLILFLALILKINLTGFLLAWGVFSGFAYLLDPVFNSLGETILTHPDLQSLWSSMYLSDAWRVTRFNNTLVMGSLAVSLIAAIPAYFIFNYLIRQYRDRVLAAIQKSKLMHMLKANRFYRIYSSLSSEGLL